MTNHNNVSMTTMVNVWKMRIVKEIMLKNNVKQCRNSAVN